MKRTLDSIREERNEWKRTGLHRQRRVLQRRKDARLYQDDKEWIDFASNDYLNLASDERLARAAGWAARRFGTGAGASPLVTGYFAIHRRLENALAAWEKAEAALVFSSGFAANLAAITAFAGQDDVLFSDQLNHASLIDGCRLARSRICIYRHNDMDHLESLLQHNGNHARRRLIVSDTVFSMDGDLAPVRDLADLARRYDCLLILDEAHATGVFGSEGRGLADALPLPPEQFIKVGTLSKALGSQGGFICSTKKHIDWLVNRGRSYVFSTALAPTSAAAALQAIKIVKAEPERRQKLLQLAKTLREQLEAAGLSTGGSASQIVPIVLGEPERTVAVAKQLTQSGLVVGGIRPPSVPPGTSRLRVSVTAGHNSDDLLALVENLRRILAND
ncbi:MAG: 8-amino-7-oxononanoate synthase [Gemmatales bacterium]|nr:MAG: 8-amino-7-oxononanoate synthase [Gemmatales bacterium]